MIDDLERCKRNGNDCAYLQQMITEQKEIINKEQNRESTEIYKLDAELKTVVESWESKVIQSTANTVIERLSAAKSSTDNPFNLHDEHGDLETQRLLKNDLKQVKESLDGKVGALKAQFDSLRQELEKEKYKNSTLPKMNQLESLRQELETEKKKVNSLPRLEAQLTKLQRELEIERQRNSSHSELKGHLERLQQELETERQRNSSHSELKGHLERLQQELETERQKNNTISRLWEHYQSLQEQQRVEKERSDQLERRISELVSQANEARLNIDNRDEIETVQAKQDRGQSIYTPTEASPAPAGSAAIKTDNVTITPVTRVELDKVLREVDETMAGAKDNSSTNKPGRKTARILRSLMADLKIVESGNDQSELQSHVNKLTESVETHEQKLKEQVETNSVVQSRLESLRSEEYSMASTPNLSNTTTGDVKQIVRFEIASRMHEALPRIKERLENGLSEEARKRQSLAEEMKRVAVEFVALHEQLDKIKSQPQESGPGLFEEVQQYSKELASLNQRVASLESASMIAKGETASDIEELRMQSVNLRAWQDSFTTKSLCKEIVDFINATLPNGLQRQIIDLASRVDQFEARLKTAEAPGLKRRRLDDGVGAAAPRGPQ
ncbi:hypothetical protein CDD81_3291 [Ophiocordyceps australis]|uniref:Uncharacterized protein n=1 Tax=Ophiocordyceps australis TaxID=1399860 RepID=A0A2C5YCG9_9HYPO|nr:hypothetical protein CDD81_3291 [Ophiocordyceps australis]